MNKFLKNTIAIITILASIAGIVGFYLQIKDHTPKLEIKELSTDKLTDLPNIEGLQATFLYKKDTVNSLWKLHYLLTNTGDETIIGEGGKKNIIRDNLTFNINEGFKILEVKTDNSKNFNVQLISDKITIKFLQWQSQESIELSVYTEQLNENIKPVLMTNEREIINGKISHTTLLEQVKTKTSLFKKLPKTLQSILWWFGIVFYGLMIIGLPIAWISELIKFVKYNKWKKSNYWMYEDWVNQLITDHKLDSFKIPKDLPNNLWTEYPYIKPTISDNEFGSFTIGILIIIPLFLTPLLLLLEY